MMAELKKYRISRKAIIIVLCALLLVVVGVIAAWVLWSNTLRSDYSTKTNSITTQTSQEFVQKITSLKDAQSSAITREILAALASTANELKTKLPAEPTILGVKVLAKEVNEKRQQINDKANALAVELQEAQDLLAYQEKVVPIIKDVRAKTGKNLDELKALPGHWQAAIDAVKSIQPPDQTSAFHTSVATSLESIKATLDTLPALYEKKDTAGFAAKQRELESKIAGLKELGHTLDSIAVQQDKQLGSQYQELRKVLQ